MLKYNGSILKLPSTAIVDYAAPHEGYDSYVIHLTWSGNESFNMAGLKINSVVATQAQCTSIKYYNNSWNELSSDHRNAAIEWGDNGEGMYGTAIDIDFTSDDPVTQVQVKTGTYWGGGSMTVTMHVAGVKGGVETDLGYTTATNTSSLIYTVNTSSNY